MRTMTLGSTGHVISRVGIGGWQAGGTGPWGGGETADEVAAGLAIRHAVESGVTWVDTAASYGLGRSEEVVRKALEPWPMGEEVLVFTKCGHPWSDGQPRTDLRPESIRAECESSLRRLGVERLDMLQFHHPDPDVPVEDSWGTLVDLATQGKVRWLGLSNFPVDLMQRCEVVRHVDAIQPPLNLLCRAAARDVIPWAKSAGVGVIVYSPLAGGALAAADSLDRADSPSADGLAEATEGSVLSWLRYVASQQHCEPAAVATAWALSVSGVTGAICGARRPEQVDAWLPAGEMTLDLAHLPPSEPDLPMALNLQTDA